MDKVNVVTQKVNHHLETIYKGIALNVELSSVCTELLTRMRISNEHDIYSPEPHTNLWNEKDIVLITYGDSIIEPSNELSAGMRRPPLQTLHTFLHKYCTHAINHVHILPFFPSIFRLLINCFHIIQNLEQALPAVVQTSSEYCL
jgi:sucrose phosphorylase